MRSETVPAHAARPLQLRSNLLGHGVALKRWSASNSADAWAVRFADAAPLGDPLGSTQQHKAQWPHE
ncbi:hypothetical protein ACFXKC_09295 [Streptomyces sp. NPDC059340]|uniref:hypothetical protein n=1 Tax=Streptomyces sp. NPDC059340 TaxID=3346806 RepID=UPI003697E8D1